MKPESEVQQNIQVEAAKCGVILMRNNNGAFTDEGGRHVRFGLDNVSAKHQENIKSSDLIGITTVVITQEMVGRTIGIFTATEIKREDWNPGKLSKHEQAQSNFIQWVINRGGIAGFANSVDSFKKILAAYFRG